MDNFDKYKGLFAEAGGFDIPSSWSLGIAVRPMRQWLLAVDYERVLYSDAPSVNNPSNLILQCAGGNASACLGGPNGAGFGWQDVSVVKIGVQYDIDDRWTVRAGYNHTDNPIRPSDVTFNVLAPGVVRDHATLGASYRWDARNEVSGAFMYAFNNTVEGNSLLNSFFPPSFGANMRERIELREWSVGLQWARKL